MKTELRSVLQSIGWDALYERHIQGLAPANAKGERRCRSPFPDTIDKNPSFTINAVSGLWHCFKTERGGDYIKFFAIMNSEEFDPLTGLATEDYGAAERQLMKEAGLSKPVDPAWVDQCRDVLFNDPVLLYQVQKYKPWNQHVLHNLKVGYSAEHNRFVFPIYDRAGRLVNCRMYRPGGAIPKTIWLESNAAGNFLWPQVAWHEKSVILVEGEPDTTSLRSIGFPAVTGTLGAGQPVPDGEWWRSKHVYVLMDDDKAGNEATIESCRRLKTLAAGVWIVKLPEWPGRPEKPDISDYIIYLSRELKYEVEQQQRAITQLLTDASAVEMPHQVYDKPAAELTFREALTSANVNGRVRFTCRVTAKSTSRFMVPVAYDIVCPAEGHAYCKHCPMHQQFHGNARFIHDPRHKDTLKLVQTTDERQLEVIKDLHGIVKQCPDVRMTLTKAVDLEAVIINAAVTEGVADEEATADRARREAYVLLPPDKTLEENREYIMDGFVYPHPKTQQGVFLINSFEPHGNSFDSFVMTPDVLTRLSQFRPAEGESVAQKLLDVSTDLMNSVTMILGRADLHLAYRTVWHSVLSFNFSGKKVNRGWIEALVLGDTRCGKSETFRQLSTHYGIGVLIDCKMQSVPGILGTVVQAASGEYYVVAGLLPQQDGRIVCFDEFTVPKGQGQSIIEVLSSTRSDGVVRISKAASAEFRARVRSIWLANPGGGKLISQCADTGVELMSRLIPQPEDIARFDFALTVAQGDVEPEVINRVHRPAPPRYSAQVARALLAWTYSRRPDQVVFSPEAETKVIELALAMHHTYSSTIPLVEIADQRIRVAKVAVSVAAQVFSTDELGENIVVLPEHVETAGQLFSLWYNKPAMGYHILSNRLKVDDTILSVTEVRHIFDELLRPNGRRFAEELLRLDEVTERTIGTIVPAEGMFMRSILQTLYKNRAIHLAGRGRREAYEKTPAFTEFLRRYLNGQ